MHSSPMIRVVRVGCELVMVGLFLSMVDDAPIFFGTLVAFLKRLSVINSISTFDIGFNPLSLRRLTPPPMLCPRSLSFVFSQQYPVALPFTTCSFYTPEDKAKVDFHKLKDALLQQKLKRKSKKKLLTTEAVGTEDHYRVQLQVDQIEQEISNLDKTAFQLVQQCISAMSGDKENSNLVGGTRQHIEFFFMWK